MTWSELVDLIQASAGVASVTVAVVALVLALHAERRNQDRFSAQLDSAERAARASVKPLLFVYDVAFQDLKAIRLTNRGQGAALITKVTISKGGREANNVVRLLDLGRPVVWDDWWEFEERPLPLSAGETMDLVKLSLEGLIGQRLTREEAADALVRWNAEISDLAIDVEHEDVLGNRQPICRFSDSAGNPGFASGPSSTHSRAAAR